MKIDNVPVIGRINKAINVLVINIVLLGFVLLILGVFIIVNPVVLTVLASALLILSGLILFNIAHNIYKHKERYLKIFDK
ncbi:MAG: hypothetical protein WC806_04545 [Candidatus Gracilibacteria bacterium]|jgi:uncharacterized membrane protein HdeD (DUF308 family)